MEQECFTTVPHLVERKKAEEMLEQVLNNYHKDENGKFTLEEVKNPPRESTRS